MRLLILRHRKQVLAYVFVVAMAAFGLWRVETVARNAESTADTVEAEVDARRVATCEQSLVIRAEQEEVLANLVRRLGGRQEDIDLVHEAYGELPTPVSCQPTQGEP